jgi:hypothetical protein
LGFIGIEQVLGRFPWFCGLSQWLLVTLGLVCWLGLLLVGNSDSEFGWLLWQGLLNLNLWSLRVYFGR